ncbi:MAG TPA: arylamine N-acetyltransferase [Sphingobium sp.]|nr:arylamine N-acetyltransferase [Sphingobium sp.]
MLNSYLRRIGFDHAPTPDAAGLALLQRAHRLAIPFENLDIMLGRGIALAPKAVQAKLVGARRGGYCFEQNSLFTAVLTALGFAVRPLLARVWLGVAGEVPPRTHMLLAVDVGGERWIADVGFGGSHIPPLPLQDGAQAETPDGARHRLRRAAMPGDPEGAWLLERAGPAAATDGRSGAGEDWQPQYGFSETLATTADIAQANHWTATRSGTRFTSLHIASRVLPAGFAAITERQLTVYEKGAAEAREIKGVQDYRSVLAEIFGIELKAEEVAGLPLFA